MPVQSDAKEPDPARELRLARGRWKLQATAQELMLYKLLLEELPEVPGDFLQTYEEQRVLPKLALTALQLRAHSAALLRWTVALTALTSMLAALTVALILVQIGH